MMAHDENQLRGRRGFSLVEMLIGISLLALILGSIATASGSGTRLFKSSVVRSQLEAQTARATESIRDELLLSGRLSVAGFAQAPFWDDRLDYDRAASFSQSLGLVSWTQARIELRYQDGEVDDGVDNNGNGLADEGQLVLIRDPGGADELETVLCRGVRELLEGELPNGADDNGNGLIDERGFCVDRSAENLNTRLSLEAVDRWGTVFTRTLETSIWLRN